ncbi:DNA-binding protein [Lacticaseibacillus paracasei]|nr:DNA-binding protein [Lacticaseibacillus paracasei]PCL33381.1 DNA-binding protein [Lacticaseibacillus paracasei]
MDFPLDDNHVIAIRQALSTLFTEAVEKAQNDAVQRERYLMKKEVCAYLKISNNTLDKWLRLGLPRINVCGTVRYDRVAIDQWVQTRMERW